MARDVPPDDLPRSPSGRVPQWVRDEATGRESAPIPWRSDTPPVVGWGDERHQWTEPRRRVNRKLVLLGALGALAIAGVVALQFVQRGSSGLLAMTPGNSTLGPPPGIGETARPTTLADGPAPAGASTYYTYLGLQSDERTPITWSPCRPIHYVVRARGMPQGALALLTSAMAEVTKYSGLRFVYDGSTTEAPVEDRALYQPAVYADTWAPVLVSFGTPSADAGESTPDLAGWARPRPVQAPDGSWVFVSGEIDLDAAWAKATMLSGDKAEVRAVMLHELGHLVGLDHTDGRRLLMNADNTGQKDFAEPELAGLASLGAGACHPDV
ncbi:MAG TPA: matrixin family metalloprotease [Candidatus Nanopelagicales bacterium]|nr:matrixin family metalloprotease [Candidatus Nanopelagicales bacterium]